MTSTLGGPVFTIGRLPDSGLPLPDANVSGAHAEIRIQSGRALLTDLGSEHGTFVAGVRLQPHQPDVLTDGARLQIGPYEIVYRSKIDVPEGAEPLLPNAGAPSIAEPVISDEPPLRFATGLPYARPTGPGSSGLLPFLPVIFHENDFLSRFLQIFETVWDPLEQRQDHIDMYFSPRTCPASWLPWFAGWFGLELDPQLPEARARALLAETLEIYRQRGTRYGLSRVIEVSTGIRPEITENPAEPHVFRVAVRLPTQASPDQLATLRRLISAHKPAHTGFMIEVQR